MARSSSDPRRIALLLNEQSAHDDGVHAPLRRARLRLADWRRAGILRVDPQASVYALRQRTVDGESLGLLCAIGVDGVPPVADAAREARLEQLGVAIEPVVASFSEPRVQRALENAIDRDADASWRLGPALLELWCIDDESTTARMSALLSQASLTVEDNAAAWSAHAAWWQRQGAAEDDGRPRAGAYALAFLHSVNDKWSEVPVGAAMAPLRGAL